MERGAVAQSDDESAGGWKKVLAKAKISAAAKVASKKRYIFKKYEKLPGL
jgi:hypothetical protein